MKERWKKVFGGWYEVSNLGNIRSVNRIGADGRRWKGRKIKVSPAKGYLRFVASINGVPKTTFVHVLVAKAFIGDRPIGKEVNHKNGNKLNCSLRNLEYKTRKQNAEHAAKAGLMPTKKNGRWRRIWHA
jgi:hypothetical protein